jgi:hypothetical protein
MPVMKVRNPIEPVATMVHLLVAFVAVLIGLGVVATIFGSGSMFGIGSPEVCVEARNGIVPVPQSGADVVLGANDDIRSSVRVVILCAEAPTIGQRILGILGQLPTFLVFVGALAFAVRLFRVIRRHGIFTTNAADGLRMTGWFVLVGHLVGTLIESVARFWLTGSMIDEPVPGLAWLGDWDVSLLALFLGVVLISFARIMRVSTAMREELDGTV